jgi:Xaa-Pro aminopeptidase
MKILHTDKRLNNNRLFPKVVLVFGLLVIFILLLSFKGNIVDSFVSISTSIFKGKKAVEEKMEALRAVKDGEDVEAMKKAGDELAQAAQKIGEAMYKKQQNDGATVSSEEQSTDEGKTQEGDFTAQS